jgi:hypothetical protein
MIISDQPGRYFTCIILVPVLILFSYLVYNSKVSDKTIGVLMFIFALIFFIYELFWICLYPSKKIIL